MDTVANGSRITWDNGLKQTVIDFRIPRQAAINSYGANMRDCYRFTIAIGEYSNVKASEFTDNLSKYANYTLNTSRICTDACGFVGKLNRL